MVQTEPHIVRGACPHDCPDSCATLAEVQHGRVVRFIADPDHPVTRGWLCAKVRPYLQRVYADDRLMYPLRRSGPKGSDRWERITWDEAITEITDRWKAIIAEDGAQAILPYSYSGTLGLVENLVASSRLWNRMGACGLERTICDAAATAASIATIGGKYGPDPDDVKQTRTLIIWGHNPASTNPHFMPVLREAQKNGTCVVVIDPRRSLTAKSADLYLQIKPATDAALALGMMHVIFRDDLHDPAWLDAHSVGWHELRERAAGFTPDRVAAITGLEIDVIESLAHRFATESPSMIKFSDGLQRHENGGQSIRSLLCLPALTGQYGIRGGGIFYSQSHHIVWDSEAVGKASQCPPVPRMVNMNRLGAALTGEIEGPPIRSLFVFIANPATSTPNSGRIIEGLLRNDLFTVVHDQFMTDTARYADIVLPATSQLEHDDLHKPYGHRHLQYNHAAVSPLGECRSNWTLMKDLAKAMGYTEPWFDQSNAEVIAEVLDATRAHNPLLAGITLERLQNEGTLPYMFEPGQDVPFAGGVFPRDSGKIALRCEAMTAYGVDPLPDYVVPLEYGAERDPLGELVLISGAAHHFVSSSMGNQPSLRGKEGPPTLLVNPADAARLGIDDGDNVEVYNQRGSCELTARLTSDVAPGVVVSPKGQWGSFMPGKRGLNWLTSDRLADLGNQSTFHSTMVSVRPISVPAASVLDAIAIPAD